MNRTRIFSILTLSGVDIPAGANDYPESIYRACERVAEEAQGVTPTEKPDASLPAVLGGVVVAEPEPESYGGSESGGDSPTGSD